MSTLIEAIGGRQSNGRFATGNPGGPGNPNARQVAQMKAALLSCLTTAELVAIFKALIEKAKEGNMQAIKMVLNYAIGKPMPMGLAAGLEWEEGSGVGGQGSGEEGECQEEKPSTNGTNGEEEGSGVGVQGSGVEVRCPESGVGSQNRPPDLTPDSGHQTPDILQPMETEVNGGGRGSGVRVQGSEALGQPSVTGVNGGKGVSPASFGLQPGQKLSRRTLLKLKRAARKAGVPFKAP